MPETKMTARDGKPGCPVTVWDGPYSTRCGAGASVGKCAHHGPFAVATPETNDAPKPTLTEAERAMVRSAYYEDSITALYETAETIKAAARREALPDIEQTAAAVHAAWMDTKRAQGVTSRPSEWGEEQMVPYADLSERAKDLDRATVRSVYAAIEEARA